MACWVCHYLTSLIFLSHPFGDPGWEFQIVRNLVERAPVPLLGLVLVFVGKFADFQVFILGKFVAGVLFVLLVPLGVSSTSGSISKTIYNSVAQPTDNTDQTVAGPTEQSYDTRRDK